MGTPNVFRYIFSETNVDNNNICCIGCCCYIFGFQVCDQAAEKNWRLAAFALTFPIYYRHTIRCIKTDRKNIAIYDEVNPDTF